jgi:hypothetical protein
MRATPKKRSAGSAHPAPRCLSDLQRGARVCGDCGSDPTARPAWATRALYDPDALKAWFEAHLFSLVLAWHCSLVLGFNLPGLLAPLVYTRESDTPAKALARYLATFGHLAGWHTGGDLFDAASPAYASVATVRTFHAAVRRNMNRDEPRAPADPAWISAYNMGCVQSGFCGAVTLVPAHFGLTPANGGSEQELARYVGFWRCVARQLGLDDSFNLCGAGEQVADAIIRQVIEEVILPDAAHPVPEVSPMSEAYVGGLNRIFCGCKVLTVKSTLAYSMDGLKKPFPRGMTLCDYMRYFGLKIGVWLLATMPGARQLLNWGARRTLFPSSSSPGAATGVGESTLKCALIEDPVVAICPASGHSLLRRRRNKGPPESCPVALASSAPERNDGAGRCCRCEPLCLALFLLLSAFLVVILAAAAGIVIGLVGLASRAQHLK